MQMASSAISTKGAWASAVEYIATVSMPRALHVRMTRCEISPRLAMSTLSNGFVENRHALRAIEDTAAAREEEQEEESNRNMVSFCCSLMLCCYFGD